MILTAIAIIFVLGYLAIALEHPIKVNKSASALILGGLLWIIWFKSAGFETATPQLFETFGGLAQILFFLLGAMTIVAIVEANEGFTVITSRIKTHNLRILIWIISWLTFFFSAVLDNLTTTIVMMTLVRKLIFDKNTRLYVAGIIIIAANAGGAFSPIGDVTTTMLWIGGQISAEGIIKVLFAPSVMALLVPLIVLTFFIKGELQPQAHQEASSEQGPSAFEKKLLFFAGVCGLLMVPAIKIIFHVPPYVAMLFVLGWLWLVVELLARKHHENAPKRLNLFHVLKEVDVASVLFFAGILLAVGTLEATGQLHHLAELLNEYIGNTSAIVLAIGILSAIVDNVPLVAATQGMYLIADYPMDRFLWEFIAYCAGTGGSMLVIGSAAGVAAMGIDKNLSFGWYLKRICPLAFLGYGAGALTYLIIAGAL
ncbi:MAG: sodium:proton antiporter NhaD [Fibromonadaceae bacterium]|jgi:Na+/H+ antiporter NhaD/arsenite permease-like protein|nr:sodium:proton antiporter NhaD [Fibromonadaceae bacterium]